MTETQSPDAMKKLVWFIILLAILGSITAVELYFAVVLPGSQAAALNVPANYCGGCF